MIKNKKKNVRHNHGKEVLYNEKIGLKFKLWSVNILEQDEVAFDEFCDKNNTDRTKLIRYFVHEIANLHTSEEN